MAKLIIDVPDDFKNHLMFVASRTGKTLKYQVLDALRKEWQWPQDRMPKDARFKNFDFPDEGPEILTNGQTPRGMPLDNNGDPDPSPAIDRAQEATQAAGRTKKLIGTPAIHPDDEKYKSADDTPYADPEPAAIIGDRDEF